MNTAVVVIALLVAGVFAAQNADLKVQPAGKYALQDKLTQGTGCPKNVVINSPTASADPVILPVDHRGYAASNIEFGPACTSDATGPVVVFFDTADVEQAQGSDNLDLSALAPLQEDDVAGPIIKMVTELDSSLLFAFTADVKCGTVFTGSKTSPLGVLFIAESDTTVLENELKEGSKYLHFIVPTENNAIQSFCSYLATGTGSVATPTASPEPTAEPCFPGSSTVELADGSFKRMDELEIGDSVRVAADKFSDVFFFGHKDEESETEFLRVTAVDGSVLSLSKNHYMYVNNVLTAASGVKVGDTVELASGNKVAVDSVKEEKMRGLFAPHTMQGDIVVDGMKASCYVRIVHPTAAHMLLAPLRALYRLGFPAFKFLEKTSRANLARALRLPVGPESM